MKIQITNDEVYEIKMPEVIGIDEFRAISSKFNSLLKIFSKLDMGDNNDGDIILNDRQIKKQMKQRSEKWNFLKDNRKIFLEILYAHYHKSNEELKKLFTNYNLDMIKKELSCSQTIRLKEFHKINPNELGLIKFPTIREPINEVLLNQGEQNE